MPASDLTGWISFLQLSCPTWGGMNGELKVFITKTDAACSECGEELGRSAWITLVEGRARFA
jgi:hypothetical protein